MGVQSKLCCAPSFIRKREIMKEVAYVKATVFHLSELLYRLRGDVHQMV